ncbi:glycerate kinase [Lentibacillus sp. CBA3610]|uniref:glycerate kinase n=1 Tax=Lentibacillus sp. CBA3610 TaxID=2518176 RepID=UPI001595DD04|nr:glycerate kinase [Lentibacillus sp. CBA3610]QKY70134.1 glycerate kinase [Lentibacillus sp. CBA3610]
MNIVLAPDSYKGSLTSVEVTDVMKQAISSLSYHDIIVSKPMADGGEGTVDTLLSSADGEQIPVTCIGPSGEKTDTYYAILQDNTAVIEIANIAGLVQVPEAERNPDKTTSYGLGEVIKDALDRGCTSFIIGLGGSATNDGGLGMLQALGTKAWKNNRQLAGIFGKDLLDITHVSFAEIDPRLADASIKVACDVENPLYGQNGASDVYGPQKGATAEQVAKYDSALKDVSSLIEKQQGKVFHHKAGAGAAGGLGFALLVLKAELVSGAKLVANASDMENAINHADLVITGEGKSDEQTLYGKAPGYIAEIARSHGTPVILISGSLTGDQDKLRSKFDGCFSVITEPMTLEACMDRADELLYEQTKQVVQLIRGVGE